MKNAHHILLERAADVFTRALDFFRICHHCGCAWERIDYVCEACWRDRFYLGEPRSLDRAWREGLIVRALFSWKDSRRFSLGLRDVGSRDLAGLMRALKGGRLLSANDRLAKAFWARLVAFEEIPRYCSRVTVLVPAPSAAGERDHAWVWAQALSTISGFPIVNLLERDRPDVELADAMKAGKDPEGLVSHQRDRNKAERRLVKLKLAAELWMNPDQMRFIFIDDVVTTGATVGAAFEALGKPKHFECWAVTCRG